MKFKSAYCQTKTNPKIEFVWSLWNKKALSYSSDGFELVKVRSNY